MTEPSYSLLHFENDDKQKSVLGGIITVLIKSYMTYVLFERTKKMLWYQDPAIAS